MKAFTLKAMAKVNLGLDVVRRMESGYHEVRMIMQTVDLYDELTFERTREGICLETDNRELPTDERNLVIRTVKRVMQEHAFLGGVKITLKKRIPMAAGMAGGSSDAAATFHGLNRLFSLGMGMEEMKKLAVQIGADVPYCLVGGTMRAEGIGEILTPLPDVPDAYLAVVKPDFAVSTKYVYENLHVETRDRHPDIDGVEAAIRRGDLYGMCVHMENILETVVEKEYPVIAQIKGKLMENEAVGVLMSGSGPTVFGIFKDREAAERACRRVQACGLAKQVFSTVFTGTTCIEM